MLCAQHGMPASASAEQPKRPNILWITSEDNGPHLGCYGDQYATTPQLDALAARGMIYWNAWSNAPVCAPARTTIISGLYPPSTGSQHMRSMTRLPEGMLMYPQYLRAAGYYCTNNSKEDYNLQKPGQVWDESSNKAHWKNRQPGQPFFAVFNHTVTHESQIRRRPHQAVHDPSQVPLPAYHPDTPESRRDWAQYYDKLSELDELAGRNLRELEAAGLADDTIVFYYGDHGPGMPRSKRWPYDSGLRVPLIVYFPPQFRHLAPKEYQEGGRSQRLVGFIDLAPTVLSLAGIQPPDFYQGHAFAGEFAAEPPEYAYGFRGRMDERYDMVRSVRDQRYVYIRNYMPHKIYGQYIAYMFETPTTRVWKQLYDQGQLQPPRTYFWERKPPEELYDLQNDPDEVRNLASSTEHAEVLERLRAAQRKWAYEIRDLGFLPEYEIHERSAGTTPYEMGHDQARYDLRRIGRTAELASSLADDATGQLIERLGDDDSAVRYWAAQGLLMRGATAVRAARQPLREALSDQSPVVQILAAQALSQYGDEQDLKQSLPLLLKYADVSSHGLYLSMLALNGLDELGPKAAGVKAELAALPVEDSRVLGRMGHYVGNLLTKILRDLP
ncbi:MAG: sulfatase-like hydrolase/transferase [Pirellulaceae bacterium]|nr:sulfatase-like hydrolase/transferase [Pirellulaceae bacterium]